MFKDQIKEFVTSSDLVNMRPAGDNIFVLKYKKKVFYNDLWNSYLEECRGTIVDSDFNLITYPFTKVYNYGIEKNAPVLAPDTQVTAFRKINGFMVSCTWHNNDVLVSTTGSTDSDFVTMAKDMMLTHMSWLSWQNAFSTKEMQGITVMFECVHPNDPHIIEEKPGMYVLGYRENAWGSSVGYDYTKLQAYAKLFNCYVPECTITTIADLQVAVKHCRHEGFVFYTADGISSKIKSPYYLTLKWVARNPRTDKLVDTNKDFKHQIDEEFYNLIDAIRANIVEYTSLDEQARLTWVRNFLEVS